MSAGKIVFTQDQIRRRTEEIAREIDSAVPGGDLHVIVTLKGALFFAVDLIRALGREATLGFITASSYGSGTKSSGEVKLRIEDIGEVGGCHVLIVEDIIDTGRTLKTVIAAIRTMGPASVRTAALIDKPSRREDEIDADFTGFRVDDIFLVGYGLDCDQEYRTLPDIRSLDP
jgi:hypoxanthine phosphoribosyltransferase